MQPGCQCQDFSGAQEVIENKTFHKWLAKVGAQNWRREYSALDGCPPADTWFFEMESTSQGGQTKMLTRTRSTGIGLARSNPLFADRELRAHASGAVELAFDHHNGDVIMKTNVAAEVCRAVNDIDRQLFRRK